MLAFAILSALVVAAAPSFATSDSERFERAILDATEIPKDIHHLPAHLPVPSTGSNIGPGSMLLIGMDDGLFICTANFIWTNGIKNYLGAAGHCFLPEGKTATHGPGADYNPSLTTVSACYENCYFGGQTGAIVRGSFAQLGPVAYARQVDSAGNDIGNDFGIVEIPSSQNIHIRASLPVFGGPTGSENMDFGELVCHYGNGVVFGEAFPSKGRVGVGVFHDGGAGAWYADAAIAPGDSGSAINVCVRDSDGIHGRGAAGIITHFVIGTVTSAGTTVAKAVQMATQAGLNISLVTGS